MTFYPEKILIFDIYADYAQFKKYFTNMSPLTFPIPPRTVVSGIIGAIIGINKNQNPESFSSECSFISLKIINAIKKVKLPTNYIKTIKREHFSRYENHKPTNVEYLKDPSFRIYTSHSNQNIYQTLKKNLIEHRSYYTLNLGISSCLANFSYRGEYDVKLKKGKTDISSVLPKGNIQNIILDNSVMLQQCTLPNIMKNNRETTEYKEFLFEINGGVITVDIDTYFYIPDQGENIVGM